MSLQTDGLDSFPSTNYTALSWRQDVLDNSYISINGTSLIRDSHRNVSFGSEAKYQTQSFFGNKNLILGGTTMHSYTNDAEQKNGSAQKLYLRFPNNVFSVNAQWQRVGEDFNPEIGFVGRSNYQLYNLRMDYNPRPGWQPSWLRNIATKPIDFFYYTNDRTKNFEGLKFDTRPLGVVFKSGDFAEVHFTQWADVPPSDFYIAENLQIKAGEYWYHQFWGFIETFGGRSVSAYAEFRIGELYNGSGTSYSLNSTWRATKNISLYVEFNRVDVSFPNGELLTNQFVSRVDVAASTTLFGSLFGQWNSVDKQVRLNFRVNWIPILGADVFFVVNQGFDTRVKWTPGTTSVIAKIVWRFVV